MRCFVALGEAEQWPADLIVMDSRGHTGIKRWLLDSVEQAVVAYAPCSGRARTSALDPWGMRAPTDCGLSIDVSSSFVCGASQRR